MKRQIEAPVAKSQVVTSRSTDISHVTNSAITVATEELLLRQLIDKLKELYIRFDTNPNFYQKEDYKKLLDVLTSGFKHLYLKLSPEIVTDWNTILSDEKIPSEKLTKETVDSLESSLSNSIGLLSSQVTSLANTKQDKLYAGHGISIANNTVSTPLNTVYSVTLTQDEYDDLVDSGEIDENTLYIIEEE